MSEARPTFARVRANVNFLQLQRLRQHYGDRICAQLLGLQTFSLGFQRQPAPVWRCVAMLYSMTFSNGVITVFDLLTSGQFPAERPQVKVACGVSLVVSGSDLVILNDYSI